MNNFGDKVSFIWSVADLLAEGGLEVRPNIVKTMARFSNDDEQEFQASYRRAHWAKREPGGLTANAVLHVKKIETLRRLGTEMKVAE